MSNEEMKNVVYRLKKNRERLNISRIPLKTKREFVDYAEREYCSDYGMAFKSLWESFKTQPKIIELYNRIEALEGGKTKKVIKTLDGREIRRE